MSTSSIIKCKEADRTEARPVATRIEAVQDTGQTVVRKARRCLYAKWGTDRHAQRGVSAANVSLYACVLPVHVWAVAAAAHRHRCQPWTALTGQVAGDEPGGTG